MGLQVDEMETEWRQGGGRVVSSDRCGKGAGKGATDKRAGQDSLLEPGGCGVGWVLVNWIVITCQVCESLYLVQREAPGQYRSGAYRDFCDGRILQKGRA